MSDKPIEITDQTLGFMRSSDRLDSEAFGRWETKQKLLTTGVKFLDKVFGGITTRDLCLIGAKTGAGKTALLTAIAEHNAKLGKNVYFFALEAEPEEIERRRTFARVLHHIPREENPNYRDFALGKYNSFVEGKEFDKTGFDKLHTFYRTKEFGVHDFVKMMTFLKEKADLIICDHIHYFDYEGENENRELSEIIKKIRDMVLILGIPVILAAHIKKSNRHDQVLVPSIDDFHGTSNLSKIVTMAVTISSGGPKDPNSFWTYFRIGKFRRFGAVTHFIGKLIYDSKLEQYLDYFELGILSQDEKEFLPLREDQWPTWIK